MIKNITIDTLPRFNIPEKKHSHKEFVILVHDVFKGLFCFAKGYSFVWTVETKKEKYNK